MDSLDLQVLQQAKQWFDAGRSVWLVTVIETWGSAPRPPGALLAMRDDGLVAGSVSGGCVEDDLIDRVRNGERVSTPSLMTYGVTKEEAARFGLAHANHHTHGCGQHRGLARSNPRRDAPLRRPLATYVKYPG